MTRLCISLAVFCALGAPAFAQDRLEGDGPGARPEEGRRGGRRGGRGMGMGMDTDKLKEQLGLSDEQVEKFDALNEANRAQMMEMREKMRSGEFDFSNMRELMTKRREEQTKKVNELLTPEQQEKFKKIQEERRSQWGQWGRGGREGGGRRGGRNRGGRDRGARVKEAALKALALDAEVAAVVTPLLDAVLNSKNADREAQRTRREAFMKKLDGADEATVTTLLSEFRAENAKAEEARKKSSEELREVLTLTQEAKLVGLGVLR